MTKKQVWLYACDFCKKKKGRSSGHMKRHEQSCTLNPNRVCRVCKMKHGEDMQPFKQRPIEELKRLLPDPSLFKTEDEFENIIFDGLTEKVNEALPALREVCGNCPACIMAALRQKGIPVPVATDFKFSDEMKAIWTAINEAAWQDEQESYHYGQY
jgi:hypothetical protein